MEGYDLHKKLNSLEKQILELKSENKEMRECLKNIQGWFNNFRFNAYGIAVEDDVEDTEEIKREIEITLRGGKVGEGI